MTIQETDTLNSIFERIHDLLVNPSTSVEDFEALITLVSSLEGKLPFETLSWLNIIIDDNLESFKSKHHIVDPIHKEEYNRIVEHKQNQFIDEEIKNSIDECLEYVQKYISREISRTLSASRVYRSSCKTIRKYGSNEQKDKLRLIQQNS